MERGFDGNVLVCAKGNIVVGFFGEFPADCEFPFLPIRVFCQMLV